MPIFEYYCSNCKELFEELVMNPATSRVACPKCGEIKKVRKRPSATSLHKVPSF